MKINYFLKTNLFRDILAIIAGGFLTLSFAPFGIFPLAIIALAMLLALWLNTSPKRAFWRGFLFGLGLFGTGIYWVFISIHTFGNTSVFLAALITIGLICLMALFPAYTGYLLNRFFPTTNKTKLVCAFPGIWVLLEWVRSWFLSGFPWLTVGSSQINSPLKGYAPIFSVFGVSLAVLVCSGLLVNIIIKLRQKDNKAALLNTARFALIWILGAALCFVNWTHPAGKPVKVSLIQGNIEQSIKWSPDQVQPTLDRYVEMSKDHWDSNIVIWPESAIPVPLHNAMDFLDQMAQTAGSHNATLITGIPIKTLNDQGYYNAVVAVGKGTGLYTKHRLVPFGEYIPMRNILGKLLDFLQVPMSDFISGPSTPQFLTANGLKISAFICYEIAFPELVLSRDDDIDMLLTVSNDAWFDGSIAQAQHVEMAQMRALEMGRPVLFVANDGITAIINAHGQIQSRAPQYQAFVLTDEVQPYRGKTPWQRYAMDPILFLCVALIIVAIRQRKKT